VDVKKCHCEQVERTEGRASAASLGNLVSVGSYMIWRYGADRGICGEEDATVV